MSTEFTDYPEALDEFDNPSQFDSLRRNAGLHHAIESAQNDAIEALEAKVGIDGSAEATSIDYRLTALETAVDSLELSANVTGTGSPESVVDGNIGRIYFDLTDPDAISQWVKTTAAGDLTGWKQLIA